MNSLPEPVSFESALEKFKTYLTSQKRSSATIIAYASDLSQLRAHLATQRITQATTVQTTHLEDFISSVMGKNYTPKSISRKINSLKTFFRFLHSTGLLPENPSTPLTHPKIERKSLKS